MIKDVFTKHTKVTLNGEGVSKSKGGERAEQGPKVLARATRTKQKK